MLDEYGYHLVDFYIFKSTWEFEYHIECLKIPDYQPISSNQSLVVNQVTNNTNNNLSQM
jgi:hypothetical protein